MFLSTECLFIYLFVGRQTHGGESMIGVLDSTAIPQVVRDWLAISPRVVRVATAFSHTPVSLRERELLAVVTSGSLGTSSAANIGTRVSFVVERRTPCPPLLAGGRTEFSWGCESLLVSVLNSVKRFDTRAVVELLSESVSMVVVVEFGTSSSCSVTAPGKPLAAEDKPHSPWAAWFSTDEVSSNKLLLLLLLLLFGCWDGGLAPDDLKVASSGLSTVGSWLSFGRWWITTATVFACSNPDWSLLKSSLVDGWFVELLAAACQLFEQRSAGMLQTRTQWLCHNLKSSCVEWQSVYISIWHSYVSLPLLLGLHMP